MGIEGKPKKEKAFSTDEVLMAPETKLALESKGKLSELIKAMWKENIMHTQKGKKLALSLTLIKHMVYEIPAHVHGSTYWTLQKRINTQILAYSHICLKYTTILIKQMFYNIVLRYRTPSYKKSNLKHDLIKPLPPYQTINMDQVNYFQVLLLFQ